MVLVIDNYDSFVHNLARYVRRLGFPTQVVRNDAVSIDQIREWHPEALILSPGPCTPNEAGISLAAVRELSGEVPMLGVCLGHQAIVQAMGGEIVRAQAPVHGRTSMIYHDGSSLFAGIASPFPACRYHSLIARRENLPTCLQTIAATEDGTIMAVKHLDYPLVGIQFHPESVLTRDGMTFLTNYFSELPLAAPIDLQSRVDRDL